MIIALLVIFTLVSHAEEMIDSISAVVDDEIILESEVMYGVHTILLESGEQYPSPERIAELRDQVLQAYATQKILIAKALEETLRVEDRIVNRELERKLESLIQQVGSKEKLVEYFGKPLRRIRRELMQSVRDQMLTEMIKTRRLSDVQIRRREVIDFFREHEGRLPSLPERVIISHIMLNVTPSKEAEKRAWDRIEKIFEMLKAGADFDSIAREHSDDPSASEGGRLGFTERGDLVPEYEEVAFQLEPGEISEVVKSRYGLHFIRLLDRQGERISSAHILVKLTPTEDDWQRVLELAGELKDRLEHGEDFAALAQEYSADEESVKKGGKLDEIAVDDLPEEFGNAVDTVVEGEIAEPFVSAFGVHIVRLDKRLPIRRINLKDDWKTVEQLALVDKKEKMFREWVNSLKKDHYIWPEGL